MCPDKQTVEMEGIHSWHPWPWPSGWPIIPSFCHGMWQLLNYINGVSIPKFWLISKPQIQEKQEDSVLAKEQWPDLSLQVAEMCKVEKENVLKVIIRILMIIYSRSNGALFKCTCTVSAKKVKLSEGPRSNLVQQNNQWCCLTLHLCIYSWIYLALFVQLQSKTEKVPRNSWIQILSKWTQVG